MARVSRSPRPRPAHAPARRRAFISPRGTASLEHVTSLLL